MLKSIRFYKAFWLNLFRLQWKIMVWNEKRWNWALHQNYQIRQYNLLIRIILRQSLHKKIFLFRFLHWTNFWTNNNIFFRPIWQKTRNVHLFNNRWNKFNFSWSSKRNKIYFNLIFHGRFRILRLRGYNFYLYNWNFR